MNKETHTYKWPRLKRHLDHTGGGEKSSIAKVLYLSVTPATVVGMIVNPPTHFCDRLILPHVTGWVRMTRIHESGTGRREINGGTVSPMDENRDNAS